MYVLRAVKTDEHYTEIVIFVGIRLTLYWIINVRHCESKASLIMSKALTVNSMFIINLDNNAPRNAAVRRRFKNAVDRMTYGWMASEQAEW